MFSSTYAYHLSPARPDDVPALAEICGLACGNDRHTMLKAAHPTKPYDHEAGMSGALEYWFNSPPGTIEITKACDEVMGEILGFVCWGMRLNPAKVQPAQLKESQDAPAADESAKVAETSVKKPAICVSADYVKTDSPDPDPLAQLEEVTSSHLSGYLNKVMPKGTRCMYVVTIAVNPEYQGRGIGEALIRHGTRRADSEGVFCWVHSSENGAAAFRKCGFEVDDTLEIDLDEWAGKMDIKPPAGDDNWGKYTFRYMIRQPDPVQY